MDEPKKVNKAWMIIAIIVLTLLILENAFLMWGISLVNADEDNEKKCVENICDTEDYDAYNYDSTTQTCYCFKGKEIALETNLK